LWAARFFKTRALASKACELGRIECYGQAVRPSREVRPGDRLNVRNESGIFEIEVLGLSETRGPASVAQALYVEGEASKLARAEAAEQRRAMPRIDILHEGKISKRDRRRFNQLRGRA
jgi:ribosome-associated heat shock protein Hsp15